jgi:hypothetical protein
VIATSRAPSLGARPGRLFRLLADLRVRPVEAMKVVHFDVAIALSVRGSSAMPGCGFPTQQTPRLPRLSLVEIHDGLRPHAYKGPE